MSIIIAGGVLSTKMMRKRGLNTLSLVQIPFCTQLQTNDKLVGGNFVTMKRKRRPAPARREEITLLRLPSAYYLTARLSSEEPT